MKEKKRADEKNLEKFLKMLRQEEKSGHTLEKYRRDNLKFIRFCAGRPLQKRLVLEYKQRLRAAYKTTSVNSMLAATNRFLKFLRRPECCVDAIRVQRRIFCDDRETLDKAEYQRLLQAARSGGDEKSCLILQTLCGTGIRVSELAYITVQTVRAGRAVVECKNKQRVILLPKPLQMLLLRYIRKNGLAGGPLFTEKGHTPINRTKVWRMMKRLCACARVKAAKVFPHNLRHLFARTFYAARHDIARLADLLGHSSIETTRIYILTSARECFRQISDLGLVTP